MMLFDFPFHQIEVAGVFVMEVKVKKQAEGKMSNAVNHLQSSSSSFWCELLESCVLEKKSGF